MGAHLTFGHEMIRLWTWTCASITLFFVVACGMAFTHLYTNKNFDHDKVAESGFMTIIGYSVGERLFEFAERLPGLDYAVILNNPVMFAGGLLVAHLGVGLGVWLVGVATLRVLGCLSRRTNRSAERLNEWKPGKELDEPFAAEVLYHGDAVADLSDRGFTEMFWREYRIYPRTDEAKYIIRNDDLWEACAFEFRDPKTGFVCTSGFVGGTRPYVRNGKVHLRALYFGGKAEKKRTPPPG